MYNAEKMTFMIFLIVLTGCLQEPGNMPTAPEKNGWEDVSPAPGQLYISEGQSEQLTCWNHNITIEYISSYPEHTIEITLDGIKRRIVKEISGNPRGIYWNERGLSFSIKPVVWEYRNGKKIPIYEKTWDTGELYFEVTKGVDQ